MKKKIIWAIVIVVFIAAGISAMNDEPEQAPSNQPQQESEQQGDTDNQDVPKDDESQDVPGDADSNTAKVSPENADTIDDIIFSNSVTNDVTGKWRLAKVTTTQDVTEYAVDYYHTFFKSDDEIHAIVNFTLNTTTSITVAKPDLFVTVREYVDGEEHDAKLLFSGMSLGKYAVDIETGEVENLK